MKYKNFLPKVLLVLALSVFATSMVAQNFEIKSTSSINIINSDITVSGGNLVFRESATFEVEGMINITIESDDYSLTISFNGFDKNGKKREEDRIIKESDRQMGRESIFVNAELKIDASKDNPFYIKEIILKVVNSDKKTTSATETFNITDSKPNFALLLNGISKPISRGSCSFGKCWCFFQTKDNDGKLIKLDAIKIKQTISKDKTDNQTYLDIAMVVNNANENNNAPTIAQLLVWGEIDLAGTAEILGKPIKWTWVGGGVTSEDDWEQPVSRINITNLTGVKLTAPVLHFRTADGSAFGIPDASIALEYNSGYEKPTSDNFTWTETWIADQKEKDPCKTKYAISDITFSESSASGYYGVQLSFQLEKNSNIPAATAMIIELTDCKGYKVYVKISLKFDNKTGTYYGSETLGEQKGCAWSLTYGEIAAYNSCKDKNVWSFDTSKAKGNGSGTKNATTQTSTRPQLL